MADNTTLKAQLAKLNILIDAYIDAITAITTGEQQSYSLDTGQSKQTVTKLNVSSFIKTYTALLNACTMLEVRLNGGGSVTVRPQW